MPTKHNNMTQNISIEDSLVYLMDTCCICDKEFYSDVELTDHLIDHTEEEKYKKLLEELDNKTSVPQRNRPLPVKRNLSNRSASPEVWEIVSDDSDEDSNTKKPKTSSFRLVKTPTKSSETPIPVMPETKAQPKISEKPSNKINEKPLSKVAEKPMNKVAEKPLNIGAEKSSNKVAGKPSNKGAEKPLNKVGGKSLNKGPEKSSQQQMDKKVFRCNKCPKTFLDDKLLHEHEKDHEKKPFVCYICNKSFGQENNLRQHLHMHIRDKTHECKICLKKFALKNQLLEHEQNEHGQQKKQASKNNQKRS